MADEQVLPRTQGRLPGWLGTLAIVAIYAAVMICTNTRYTILDDEADDDTHTDENEAFHDHFAFLNATAM